MDRINTWEEVACEWCGSDDGLELFTGQDLLMNFPGQFRLVRCQQCGLIRQNPRLAWESLKTYYGEDYNPYQGIIEKEPSRLRRMDRRYGMWKRIRAIERHQPSGRLLDVGCGTGIFLAEIQRTGRWDLMAVEPSPDAAAYVQRELKIPVVPRRFSEADLPSGGFDVITLWNVLEHLDHPIQDLRRAASLLRKGGWLVLSLPNVESLEAKVLSKYWIGWDLPRHLYLFPQVQLDTILREIGLETRDKQCIAGSHASFGLSLEFWLNGTGRRRNKLLTAMVRAYQSLPARLLTVLPFYLLNQLRLSSVITIFAQKI